MQGGPSTARLLWGSPPPPPPTALSPLPGCAAVVLGYAEPQRFQTNLYNKQPDGGEARTARCRCSARALREAGLLLHSCVRRCVPLKRRQRTHACANPPPPACVQ